MRRDVMFVIVALLFRALIELSAINIYRFVDGSYIFVSVLLCIGTALVNFRLKIWPYIWLAACGLVASFACLQLQNDNFELLTAGYEFLTWIATFLTAHFVSKRYCQVEENSLPESR